MRNKGFLGGDTLVGWENQYVDTPAGQQWWERHLTKARDEVLKEGVRALVWMILEVEYDDLLELFVGK